MRVLREEVPEVAILPLLVITEAVSSQGDFNLASQITLILLCIKV
jgi:hypothetical protein